MRRSTLAKFTGRPIAPIGSHQLDDKDVVAAALRQNLSLFGRDLMRKLDRGLWRWSLRGNAAARAVAFARAISR